MMKPLTQSFIMRWLTLHGLQTEKINMKLTFIILVVLLLSFGCASSNEPITAANVSASSNTTQPNRISSNIEPEKYLGMTNFHNEVRRKHGVPALKWSPRLAVHAQQWANYLATRNGCVMQHRPLSGEFKRIYGENIFWASPRRWSDGRVEIQPISAEDVVFSWADEEKFYNYANNSCQRGEICGHYTQLVWKTSTEVGCGMRICPDKGQMWVCSYNPPGNYINERPY